MNRRSLVVDDPLHEGMRVDRFLSEVSGLFTRSQLKQRLIEARVDGRPVKLSRRLAIGETVEVDYLDERPLVVVPEAIDLAILYEDENVIVVDKPQGMVVHPAPGSRSGTLVQALAYHCLDIRERLSSGEGVRPGIVHRLDKDTSGVLIAARNVTAQEMLAAQFRRKSTEKLYLAVVKGRLHPTAGSILAPIGRDPTNRKRFRTDPKEGKPSSTDYRVLRQWERHAFVALRPRTGRTHQLRVHLASLGHPILGDPIYGRVDPAFPLATLMLHAYRLSIALPSAQADPDERTRATFRAPLPTRFKELLVTLAADAKGS